MLDKIRNLTFVELLTLILTLLALVSPIIWDWYKEKVDITIQIKSVASVISKDLPIQNLEILYGGKKVNALNRVSIEIENTGRTPITSGDVIKPIELKFRDSEIIEAKIVSLYPSNLDFVLDMPSANTAVASFSLLNPKDKVKIDLLLLGVTAKFDAKARIKNVDEINIIDNLGKKDSSPLSFYFLPMMMISLIVFWYGISEFIPSWSKKLRARSAILKGTDKLYSLDNFKSAIESVLENKNLSTRQQKNLLTSLNDHDFPLSDPNKEKVISEVTKQESFSSQKLTIEFVFELALLIIFGLLPVIGILKIYLPFK